MKVDLAKYEEVKVHRLKRIVWAIVNASLFKILSGDGRASLLRLFGAKIGASLVYRSVKIYAPWNLEIGDAACIGPRVELYNKEKISIGDSTAISQDSYICTASHDVTSPIMAPLNKPITIGSSAWIAAKATVLLGVTIGEGAVVGCAAVVTRDVDPWTVVGGNPAKFIKNRELSTI